MKKLIIYFLLPAVTLIIGLYVWGSSKSNFKEKQLNEVIRYPAEGILPKDTFKVMTYNIGYLSGMTNNLPVPRDSMLFANNLLKIIYLLNKENPDFVGFQEIDYSSRRSFEINQLDSIATYANFHQVAKAINWDKNYVPFPYWPTSTHFGKIVSGQAILSKYTMLEAERIAFEKPASAPFFYKAFYLDRLLQISKIDLGKNVPLIIMNVHLEAFDKETREKQAQKLLTIYRKYTKEHPVLLIGDFNARPPYATNLVEVESTISDILAEKTLSVAIPKEKYIKNESDYFTFNTEKPYEKIDYIFYNKDKIKSLDAYVIKEAKKISDHLPLVMKFTWAQDSVTQDSLTQISF